MTPKNAISWSSNEDKILLALDGESSAVMARVLGRDHNACELRLDKLRARKSEELFSKNSKTASSVKYLRSRGYFIHSKDGQFVVDNRHSMTVNQLNAKAARVKRNTALLAA